MFNRRRKQLEAENLQLKMEIQQLKTENKEMKQQLFQYWEVLYGTEKDVSRLKSKMEHYKKKSLALRDENERLSEHLKGMSEVARESIRKSRRSRHHSRKDQSRKKEVMINDNPEVHYVSHHSTETTVSSKDDTPKSILRLNPKAIPSEVLDNTDSNDGDEISNF